MTALALRLRHFTPPRPSRGAAFRAVAGGTVWGLVLSGGLLSLTYYSCGVVCTGDALVTTALSVAAGIVTIGPVTVLASKD
jgi:hypothetical protein